MDRSGGHASNCTVSPICLPSAGFPKGQRRYTTGLLAFRRKLGGASQGFPQLGDVRENHKTKAGKIGS
ncbi:unnamed protein product [Acanthoscelides obtectus]|uniref:Uncharacterized protein n=1 Tax=Acanthoscelides obtectus TaxID=200917 RepID=A0A9P0M167_ACAOB|nr:unnamed protein product [Acanthoscelides obtectus]CAK1640636.1 hypothetical protein AOBTE_LOCUS11833 [Acanthoscelides obtectus]